MAKQPIIELSEHDKRILGVVGRAPYGREFVGIMRKVREQLCSLDSVDRDKDFNDQVEGRLIFKDFADELIEHLGREQQVRKQVSSQDFES